MSMIEGVAQQTGINWGGAGGHVGTVEYGGGVKGQVAFFYHKSVEVPAKSRELGRRFFEDSIFVRIAPPGERLNIVERPANEDDRVRWPQQWARFAANQSQIPDGTPVDLLFPAQPAIADNLRGYGVHTVEQLAELSADAIGNIMGGQNYVNQARKYLDQAQRGVGFHEFTKQLEDRDQKLRLQDRQIAELRADVGRLTEALTSGAGMQSRAAGTMAGVSTHPAFPAPAPLAPRFDAQAAQIAAVDAQTRGGGRAPRKAAAQAPQTRGAPMPPRAQGGKFAKKS